MIPQEEYTDMVTVEEYELYDTSARIRQMDGEFMAEWNHVWYPGYYETGWFGTIGEAKADLKRLVDLIIENDLHP